MRYSARVALDYAHTYKALQRANPQKLINFLAFKHRKIICGTRSVYFKMPTDIRSMCQTCLGYQPRDGCKFCLFLTNLLIMVLACFEEETELVRVYFWQEVPVAEGNFALRCRATLPKRCLPHSNGIRAAARRTWGVAHRFPRADPEELPYLVKYPGTLEVENLVLTAGESPASSLVDTDDFGVNADDCFAGPASSDSGTSSNGPGHLSPDEQEPEVPDGVMDIDDLAPGNKRRKR